MSEETALCINDVHVVYPNSPYPVLRGGGMSVCKGELACLLGTSGCGKTTVLRAVAGFERLNKGKFLYHSIVWPAQICIFRRRNVMSV
ncbi:ATP-binding cassette domain-containing protein [Escherichia coli]|nr:ATP-binding cassette domain-containing protein [Escherichia coli]